MIWQLCDTFSKDKTVHAENLNEGCLNSLEMMVYSQELFSMFTFKLFNQPENIQHII